MLSCFLALLVSCSSDDIITQEELQQETLETLAKEGTESGSSDYTEGEEENTNESDPNNESGGPY